eukprot:TRINITY_DN180_c0_g1_i1.p1 TRINITY_DN180_c0_g1~~TRINITY_DN180_c0_g1_i1.p1  ORF type:complete len:165 (-),score=19.84 TRINITY_DN180_c0_g1_i1:379-873(-)
MAFSATLFHPIFFFSRISLSPQTLLINPRRSSPIKATNSAEPEEKQKIIQTATEDPAKSLSSTPKPPKKPVYSMKKGQIVRVDKEKYLNSVNYLSVGHPPYYKGLDYIYEDRGEVLDIRIFETGEYALIVLSLVDMVKYSCSPHANHKTVIDVKKFMYHTIYAL